VLDSGGFGTMTITEPMAIISPPGVYAGISVFSGDGITVTTANPGDRVTLNGLTVNSQGSTGNGILYNGQGRRLVINATVNGFSGAGRSALYFHPSASSNLRVENSEFRVNYWGVNVEPQGAGTIVYTVLEHVVVASSGAAGIYLQNQTIGTLRDVHSTGN